MNNDSESVLVCTGCGRLSLKKEMFLIKTPTNRKRRVCKFCYAKSKKIK